MHPKTGKSTEKVLNLLYWRQFGPKLFRLDQFTPKHFFSSHWYRFDLSGQFKLSTRPTTRRLQGTIELTVSDDGGKLPWLKRSLQADFFVSFYFLFHINRHIAITCAMQQWDNYRKGPKPITIVSI